MHQWGGAHPYDFRRIKYPAAIKPPAARATNKITMPIARLPAKGDAFTGSVGVAVGDDNFAAALSTIGDGARVAVEGEVSVAVGGMGVSEAGGVTCSSSFCPVMIIELVFNPFHAISSPMSTP